MWVDGVVSVGMGVGRPPLSAYGNLLEFRAGISKLAVSVTQRLYLKSARPDLIRRKVVDMAAPATVIRPIGIIVKSCLGTEEGSTA